MRSNVSLASRLSQSISESEQTRKEFLASLVRRPSTPTVNYYPPAPEDFVTLDGDDTNWQDFLAYHAGLL